MTGGTRPLGRPRSDAIDGALFRAAHEIVGAEGYGRLTIERIAALSGISKASIYRRFQSRAELAAEALLAVVGPVSVLEGDEAGGSVERYLRDIFRIVRERAGPMLQGLMADAQLDPRFREIFRERFVRERRDAFARAIEAEYGRPANLEVVLDFALGLMWYRLLVGHGALGDRDAAEVAAALGRLIAVNAVARPS